MPSSDRLSRAVDIERSSRVMQLEGMFDVPPSERVERVWEVHLPLEDQDWNIGLIVGPSGSGKSTILADRFPVPEPRTWPERSAVIDGFPAEMGVKQITAALSAVGFSSPPAWLRPYATLSNGEQFRADLARTLAESESLAVIDEFTSVVDRTVAQIASAACAKFVRRSGRKLIAASCHYDIIEWLQPDWIYDTGSNEFAWRCLQRHPQITIEIYRTTTDAWRIFHPHHYLSGDLHKGADCFVGLVNDRPAVFCSALHFPHARSRGIWREHRTVCIPDFQGVGIGNAMSETIGSYYRATNRRFRSTTSSPAMIRHRARSPFWDMDRRPSLVRPQSQSSSISGRIVSSETRLTASFEYVGPLAEASLVEALSA